MTNKHASQKHGLNDVKKRQPKSKLRVRRNKAQARQRKEERRALALSE